MDTSQLFPRVVQRTYFSAAGITDPLKESHRLGFVRLIGHDVYAFLAHRDGDVIHNVHQEDLDSLGLAVQEAQKQSLENLRSLAFDGRSIIQQLTKTSSGNDWAVWYGNELTCSCLLLPELFTWGVKQLGSDDFLVCVPSAQMLFILQYGSADSIPAFDNYIARVVDDSKAIVSSKWFRVNKEGISPWAKG